jgi:hypothetical protein
MKDVRRIQAAGRRFHRSDGAVFTDQSWYVGYASMKRVPRRAHIREPVFYCLMRNIVGSFPKTQPGPMSA